MKFAYGILTCLSVALLVTSEGTHPSCRDGLGLSYTLPMFNECTEKEHPNGSMVQTIPKLIPFPQSGGGCPSWKSKTRGYRNFTATSTAQFNLPPGYRVCRFPDCERNLCGIGCCEETMQGYRCHCSDEFHRENDEKYVNPPNLTCSDDMTFNVVHGTSNLSVQFTPPSAISANVTLVRHNYNPGDDFQLGSTVVEYVFADDGGIHATCNFTITINTYDFHEPLGLESKIIPGSSLSASSSWTSNDHCRPWRARLNTKGNLKEGTWFCGAWAPAVPSAGQWIQVDLLTTYSITGVATQGRQDVDQWVTSFMVNCSIDGVIFHTVKDWPVNAKADKVFMGNSDRNSVVYNALPVAESCRFVRLIPISWKYYISLRMELYGKGPLTAPDWKCSPSKCYRLDDKVRNWQDARSFCHNLEPVITLAGDKRPSLLFLNTVDEFEDIMDKLEIVDSFWVNCNDLAEEGDFVCDVDGSGTASNATFWRAGEPNGTPFTRDDCVAVTWSYQWGHGRWQDIGCAFLFHTVCQILL